MWLDMFTFLGHRLNFVVFFSREKKISQIVESLARKWNTLERNRLATVATWLKRRESITLVKAKGEHNSGSSKGRA